MAVDLSQRRWWPQARARSPGLCSVEPIGFSVDKMWDMKGMGGQGSTPRSRQSRLRVEQSSERRSESGSGPLNVASR